METEFYIQLKARCKQHGISISELCRRTGVSRSTIARWRIEVPQGVENYKNIEDYFTKEKNQNINKFLLGHE